MFEYEPQEISNIAWSFARLKIVDAPLLHSIASAALHRLYEFTSLNIANTAWAFSVLSQSAHLDAFLPLAASRFLEVAQESVGTEWVDMASIARSHGPFPGKEQLIQQFESYVLLPAMQHLAAILNPEVLQTSALRELKN
jgi:hypothetical protein